MSKAKRNELKAVKCFKEAGGWVHKPNSRSGPYDSNEDMFNQFDLAALLGERLYLVQVKSNRPDGIRAWFETTEPFQTVSGVETVFMVHHDYEGWRVAEPDSDGTHGYSWAVDERSQPADIGELVVGYLETGQ